MSDQERIDIIFDDPVATHMANEAAERLSYAIGEIDRLVLTIQQMEDQSGTKS